MQKEAEKKIIVLLTIITIILSLNTICHFIEISKLSNNNEIEETNTPNNSQNTYDVSMFNSLSPSEILKKIKSGEEIILFIGQENCTYCKKMLPTIQQAQNNYGYKTTYLNIATSGLTSSNEYKELTSLLDIEKTVNGETKKFGEFQYTPMVAILRNGKMVDGMIGYNTYENFAKFLESAGIKK